MSTVGVTGVVAGVVDGSSSIIQHIQELQKNPNDQVAFAQVNADFQNTIAAMTALVPGIGASTAFVALSADFNLLIQKIGNGAEISQSDFIPIVGNLVTLTGQVVEAAGLAGTPATGGLSLVAGITAGEALDGLGAAVNFYGLGVDVKDVRATLGQLADAMASSTNQSAPTAIPQVIITGDRVTTISSAWSSDGKTLTENLSDQSTRFTTISPDGTSVTKVFQEADGHTSMSQSEFYTDSSRSTLSSAVESATDSATNKTTITTTYYNSGIPTFDTEVIDNANPGTIIGSATGSLNQDGSISSGSINGSGIQINANGANITVNSGAQVGSAGLDNTINATGAQINVEDNSRANIVGDNNFVTAGANDNYGVYGSNNWVYSTASSNVWLGGTGTSSSDVVFAEGGTVTVYDTVTAAISPTAGTRVRCRAASGVRWIRIIVCVRRTSVPAVIFITVIIILLE